MCRIMRKKCQKNVPQLQITHFGQCQGLSLSLSLFLLSDEFLPRIFQSFFENLLSSFSSFSIFFLLSPNISSFRSYCNGIANYFPPLSSLTERLDSLRIREERKREERERRKKRKIGARRNL